MKILYIDAQNIHKSTLEMGWIIDREAFLGYSKKKFGINTAKIFFGYIPRYETFYKQLRQRGYEVVFKETMILPTGETKGNVDIDIAIHGVLDQLE